MVASEWRPRTLILQHEPSAPAGFIYDWLEEQGADVEILPIAEVKPAVDVRSYDLIVSLGSEFAAYDDTRPFVPRERHLLAEAFRADVPVLGVCFGSQILARVLGGRAFRNRQPEIGWHAIRTRDRELIPEGPWFQWHFDSFTPPPGATVIAETDAGPQAFVVGRNLGLQFHPEVTPDIVERWMEYAARELEAEGIDPNELLAETRRRVVATRELAFRLLDRFRDTIATAKERGQP